MLHVRKARAVPWLQDLFGRRGSRCRTRLPSVPDAAIDSKGASARRAESSATLPISSLRSIRPRRAHRSAPSKPPSCVTGAKTPFDSFAISFVTGSPRISSKAPDDVPVPKPATPAQGHYAVLGVLYNFASDYAGRSWSVTPGAEFDATGLDDDEQQTSLDTLLFHNLVKRIEGGYTLLPTGARAYVPGKPSTRSFRSPSGRRPPRAPSRPPGDATKVTRVRDDLAFMRPGKLRERVEADLVELGVAVEQGIDKTQMMFCGLILEAVLFDVSAADRSSRGASTRTSTSRTSGVCATTSTRPRSRSATPLRRCCRPRPRRSARASRSTAT